MNKLSVLLPILLVAYATSDCNFETDWEYQLRHVYWNSTNEEAFNAALNVVRVNINNPVPTRYGDRGVNGTVTIGTQLDNSFRVNLYIDKSRQYNFDRGYERIQYGLRNTSFYDFMNGVYKSNFMYELHRCANQQLFDKMTEPVKPHKVYLNSCSFLMDCFIEHFRSGFYRLTFEFIGEAVTFVGTAIVVVEGHSD